MSLFFHSEGEASIVKLSAGEKLILLALADLAKPEDERELNLGFVANAILYGHPWALDWEFGFLSEDNDTSVEVARETGDILTMWRNIEDSVSRLSPSDREHLNRNAPPHRLEFEGFDGNHDKHFGVAGFLVNRMNRFAELKGRVLNSHSQGSLPTYRQMLKRHRATMDAKSSVSDYQLTAEEILFIVKPN